MFRSRFRFRFTHKLLLLFSALLGMGAAGCCQEGNYWTIRVSPSVLETFPGESKSAQAETRTDLELLAHGLTWGFDPVGTTDILTSWGKNPASGSLTTMLTVTAKSEVPGEGPEVYYNGNGSSLIFNVANTLATPVDFKYDKNKDESFKKSFESTEMRVAVYKIRLVGSQVAEKATYTQGSGTLSHVSRLAVTVVATVANDESGRPYTFQIKSHKRIHGVTKLGGVIVDHVGGTDDVTITPGNGNQSVKVDFSADFSTQQEPGSTAYVLLSLEILATRDDGITSATEIFNFNKKNLCVLCD